jgi:16S rRNA (cytosine967-C5)-methyltransferase
VLVANEAQPHRAALVRRNLTDPASGESFSGTAGVVAGDGRRPPFGDATFDRVLVDAPCSGLGALRRRPEARWRRQPQDLDTLVPLQRELLASALRLVRPGGVVLYATCSPVLAETQGVVEAVLAEHPAARLEPVTGWAGDVPDGAGPVPGTVQLWPHRHGTDAMFMALLRRV